MLFDPRILAFGETAVVILDCNDFADRVRKAFKGRGWKAEAGVVDYVDKNEHVGAMGALRKYDELVHQSEYRFVAYTDGDAAIDDFYIGDITDISIMCDSKCLSGILKFRHLT